MIYILFIFWTAENDPHDGKRKCETLWPIFKIAHQKSRYVFDLYHRRKEISKELYEFCLDQGYADRNLIAKWKKVCFTSSLKIILLGDCNVLLWIMILLCTFIWCLQVSKTPFALLSVWKCYDCFEWRIKLWRLLLKWGYSFEMCSQYSSSSINIHQIGWFEFRWHFFGKFN